jgi:3-dehydroquinate dehydratase
VIAGLGAKGYPVAVSAMKDMLDAPGSKAA